MAVSTILQQQLECEMQSSPKEKLNPRPQWFNLAQEPNQDFHLHGKICLLLLRDELQEYGGLVGLLNAQQQSILDRRTDSLMEINQSVQTQMEASQMLQKRRQGMVCTLAKSFGESERSTLSELVPHFPDVTRPMFESIIEEINSLITRVREKVMQNQRLLARVS